jgi:hypothetical protein
MDIRQQKGDRNGHTGRREDRKEDTRKDTERRGNLLLGTVVSP